MLGAALEGLTPHPIGVGVFDIEDGSGFYEVGGYFTEKPDDIALALLAALYDAKQFLISEIPDKNWVAEVERELAPIEVQRFFIYGSHDKDKIPHGKTPLLIDVSMAFGTGHHATTRACLSLLDNLASTGFHPKTILDVGCGTAILAIAASKIWQCSIWASDNDAIAIDVADKNIKANNAQSIQTEVATGLDATNLQNAAPYDVIFANILKDPLMELAESFAQALSKTGVLILSGILSSQSNEIVGFYKKFNLREEKRVTIGEWDAILFKRAL